MKGLFTKYFGRLLAVLGCTTMVTACYGVPYNDFCVQGKVVDSETEEPIQDIQITVAPQDGTPLPSTSTNSHGIFVVYNFVDIPPSGYTIECTDIDGALNGSYEDVVEEFTSTNGDVYDVIIKMTPKNNSTIR